MESNKNFIIIMSFIGVLIVVLLIIFVINPGSSQNLENQTGNQIVDNNGYEDNTNSTINDNDEVTDEETDEENSNESVTLTKLNDYNIFFSLNTLISNYYSSFTTENYDKIINFLDNEYRIKNNIKKENVSKLFSEVQGELSYTAKTIYVKENSKISYYFINGDTLEFISTEHSHDENSTNHEESGSQIIEEENVCYLIIYDKTTNRFSLTPLATTNDLYNYSEEYKIQNKTISENTHNRFNKTTYTDEMVARNYISYFLNIMYINTEKAFNMLENNYKNSFGTLQNFTYNLNNISSKISTNFLGYNVTGENGKKTYVIQMRNNEKMIIYEEGIMNIKVKID